MQGRYWRTATVLLILGLCIAAARAADAQISPSVKALAASPSPQKAKHLLGDWSGARKRLESLGIAIELKYLSETAWNIAGGKRIGADYAGEEEATFGVDLGKLAGLQGLSLHIDLLNRNGRNASADYIGDHLLHAQEIYGAGGDVLVHLSYAYLEQKLSGGSYDLKAGRMPVIIAFGSLPDACDFMALGICATRPLTANLGFTAYPYATWGANLAVKLAAPLSLKLGIYEVNPRRGEPSGFYWSFNGTRGAMLPVELDWKTKLGAASLPGLYKLGGYFDTANFRNWPLNGLPQESQRTGFYFLAQQMVWRTGAQPGEGLTVLAGYVHNRPDNALFQHFAFIGLLDKGLVPGRPDDRAGLAFVHARVSADLSDAQALQSALGLPLSNGAPGVQSTEMLLEANYDIAAWRGVGIMPDLQWVIHPDGLAHRHNALVLGLQVSVIF